MKLKHLAAAAATAALAITGVASIATAPASAATPSCGKNCLNLYSQRFAITQDGPEFVLDVYKQGQKIGQPLILFRTSNSDPAEDFVASEQGTVNAFFQAGLVSPEVALNYGCVSTPAHPCTGSQVNDQAYELEYAPFGAESGLCAGVPATAAVDTKVSLQPCGASAKTVWIVDPVDSPGTLADGEAPLINASDTNFSHPFVLTYPSASFPTDKPRPQLFTTNLTGEASGSGPVEGTISDDQLWSYVTGPLS